MPARKRNRQPKTDTLLVLDSPTWHIETPGAIPRLIDEIFDPTRYRPLLLVSESSDTRRPRIDVTALFHALGDNANIAVLAGGETTHAFSDAAPEHFRAYGGGIRLCWPYASKDDPHDRHPLFITRTEDDGPRTIDRIIRALTTKGFMPEPENLPSAETTAPWTTSPGTPDSTETETERLRRERDAALAKARTLTAENNDLRRTVHSLTDTVEALHQRLCHTRIFSDPEKQLRHEIEYAWLLSRTEADREEHPLSPYAVGSNFLRSVEAIEGVERDKIIATCVDVLTRRAWQINGRSARQMRTSDASGSPSLVRQDGAAAWRCNIQTGTASARRLMWWELPDGTIELSAVALHDDVEMT